MKFSLALTSGEVYTEVPVEKIEIEGEGLYLTFNMGQFRLRKHFPLDEIHAMSVEEG